jgi:hypothetical protein
MKKTIYFNDFVNEFNNYDRGKNFTHSGLHALFDYLEMLEYDGYEIELDVIALCDNYTEYTDFDEIKEDYPYIEDIDDLEQYTEVISFLNGIIIADF